MSDTSTPAGGNSDRLLTRRAEIAEFVNSFTSERVQRKAFEAVVAALGLVERDSREASPVERLHIVKPEPIADDAVELEPAEPETAGATKAGGRRRRAKAGAKRSFSIKKGLNFAPDGEPSLESVVEEKKPRNANERCLLACYYLSEHLGLKADVEHVLAVFQAAGQPMPADPGNALQKTASTTNWIDTSDMTDIKVLWAGENHFKSKMPAEVKKKTG